MLESSWIFLFIIFSFSKTGEGSMHPSGKLQGAGQWLCFPRRVWRSQSVSYFNASQIYFFTFILCFSKGGGRCECQRMFPALWSCSIMRKSRDIAQWVGTAGPGLVNNYLVIKVLTRHFIDMRPNFCTLIVDKSHFRIIRSVPSAQSENDNRP